MKARKKMILRIILSSLLLISAVLIKESSEAISFFVFLLSYIIIGYNVVLKALKNILKGQVFDENFLMTIATIGAFIISEYTEGIAVMLFYQVGELFQNYAVNKSRKSISELMDIRPDYANVKREDEIFKIDPEKVLVGETIIIKPGERVPLDCIIISGNSTLDTSSLTGESMPRDISQGDEVLSGCINISGVITGKTTKEFKDSTVNRILDLVENASDKKSKAEHFITKFSRYYTPVVVILALIMAIIPPIFFSQDISTWTYRALSFLVVSCPCALVISIPLSFFAGIGGASKKGILIKGSNYIEVLSKVKTIVFDKTGTLTKGEFNVMKISSVDISEDELLKYATYAENYSNHPISTSLKRAYKNPIDLRKIKDVQEIIGHGVKAIVDGNTVYVGNEKLMNEHNIKIPEDINHIETILYVAINNSFKGYILISDEIKLDSKKAISLLKKSGINKSIMLTGDKDSIGQKVSNSLNIDKTFTQLLPTDKVEITEKLLNEEKEGCLAFVGDGINDAPALARADVGIAMGCMGSDAAIEAADIVIMTDEPLKIATAFDISKRTINIVKGNIIFALGIKAGVLVLTAFGLSSMWQAVFADVGVSVIAILNATRMLSVKRYEKAPYL